MENCNILEEFFEPTVKQAAKLEKPKHKVPKDNHTTEHQQITSRTNGQKYEIKFGPQDKYNVPANPFASEAQARYMHAHPDILGSKIKEWDAATNFKTLPKRKK